MSGYYAPRLGSTSEASDDSHRAARMGFVLFPSDPRYYGVNATSRGVGAVQPIRGW